MKEIKEKVKPVFKSPKQVSDALKANWSERVKVWGRQQKVKELAKTLKEMDKTLTEEHKELMDALMMV